jgi:hypothetical protein
MITVLIIVSVALIVSSWLLYVQFVKVAKLVTLLEIHLRLLSVTAVHVNRAYKRMREADRIGAFEADDEVGFTFHEIKQAVTELNSFLEKYVDNDQAKEK